MNHQKGFISTEVYTLLLLISVSYHCVSNNVKRFSLLFLTLIIALTASGQYRELIYYKVPVGAIKYFHKDENVTFKLKSEDKFDIRKGIIYLLSDTLYEINNIRFRPDNLEWISSSFTKRQRSLKNFAGTFLLAGGLAASVYGVTKFPDEDLENEDSEKYHQENVNALTIIAAGLCIAAVSIPVYIIQPKKYKLSKNWRIRYQR